MTDKWLVRRRVLPDGRYLDLVRMLFNWRLLVSDAANVDVSWEDAWCYQDEAAVHAAFENWDGIGEPAGWNKHPTSGRWRHDGTPESEINQRTHEGPWR